MKYCRANLMKLDVAERVLIVIATMKLRQIIEKHGKTLKQCCEENGFVGDNLDELAVESALELMRIDEGFNDQVQTIVRRLVK